MRAVNLSVSEAELRERRSRGADRWDEMWDGELHMVPPPNLDHQDLVSALCEFLRTECRRRKLGRVFVQAGLYDPENLDGNYRVPDLMFVAAGHTAVLQPRGVVGAADAVIEVRSPDDETYEKFPLFARLGVLEIVVIDRATRRPEVYRLGGKQYLAVATAPDGWVTAEVQQVRLRVLPDGRTLRIEPLDDPARGMEV